MHKVRKIGYKLQSSRVSIIIITNVMPPNAHLEDWHIKDSIGFLREEFMKN